MTMFKTKDQIEDDLRDNKITHERFDSHSEFYTFRDGYAQAQQDIKEELKRLCTYNSTAIGKQAECYLKVMPTLVDIIDKHSIGVFLRGIIYRTYTQAQQDIKEACSEGFEESYFEGHACTSGDCNHIATRDCLKEAYKTGRLSMMKELQEKDEEIERLKKFPLNGVVCECTTDCDCILKMKEKYQKAVKDIAYLEEIASTLLLLGDKNTKTTRMMQTIRTKYGLDKEEK